jgi:hypothetical protein
MDAPDDFIEVDVYVRIDPTQPDRPRNARQPTGRTQIEVPWLARSYVWRRRRLFRLQFDWASVQSARHEQG